MWGVGCEVWGVGCGVWGVGCGVYGLPDDFEYISFDSLIKVGFVKRFGANNQNQFFMTLTNEDLLAVGQLIDKKLEDALALIRNDIEFIKHDIETLKKDVSDLKSSVVRIRLEIEATNLRLTAR